MFNELANISSTSYLYTQVLYEQSEHFQIPTFLLIIIDEANIGFWHTLRIWKGALNSEWFSLHMFIFLCIYRKQRCFNVIFNDDDELRGAVVHRDADDDKLRKCDMDAVWMRRWNM